MDYYAIYDSDDVIWGTGYTEKGAWEHAAFCYSQVYGEDTSAGELMEREEFDIALCSPGAYRLVDAGEWREGRTVIETRPGLAAGWVYVRLSEDPVWIRGRQYNRSRSCVIPGMSPWCSARAKTAEA